MANETADLRAFIAITLDSRVNFTRVECSKRKDFSEFLLGALAGITVIIIGSE